MNWETIRQGFVIFILDQQAKERISGLVQMSVENGARFVLDGRDIVVQICVTNCIDVHDSKMKHFPLKVLNFPFEDTEFSELALQIDMRVGTLLVLLSYVMLQPA